MGNSLVGQVINQTYEIEELLGRGGMGSVYRARHLSIGDKVAIKVISSNLAQNSDAMARFRREAQAARRLAHPNAVTVFDFNITADGLVFMVMEYVDGQTVEKYLQKHNTLAPQRALELLRPVAAALDVAHSLGIIHRDLKPANLMLTQDSAGNELVKILDFGTARFTIEQEDEAKITQEGQIFGTPLYMAPEQVMGEEIGAATDIYALGVILYQMLTGGVPFLAGRGFQSMMAHVMLAPDRPSLRCPDLDGKFDEIILQALEKEPARRYASAGALIDRFAAALCGNEAATTGSLHKRLSLSGKLLPPPTPLIEQPDFTIYIGRDGEFQKMQAEYQRALAQKARPLFLIGPPGIGKTQLTARFREWAGEQGALVLAGKFFDYGGSTTEPLRLFKNMLVSVLPGSTNSNGLDSIAETNERISRFLNQEFGGAHQRAETEKWQIFETLTMIFAKLAEQKPLVLVLDDLQWADSLSLDFIGYLLRNTERLCFIGTARADEANSRNHPLGEWLVAQTRYFYYEKIGLENFDKEMINTLLQNIFHNIEISEKDLATLLRITGGNPLYLMEMTRMLYESQKIYFLDGIWSVTPFDEVKLPDTISNVVQYKLKNCASELRELLTQAAVVGDDFRFEILQEVSGLDEVKLEKLLAAGVSAFLLCEEKNALGDDYRFFHTTIRRVIYDEIPQRQRRRLHARAAAAEEQIYRGKLTRVLGSLAYHYYAASEWARAFDYSVKALDQAWEKESWSEVAKYAQWAEEAISAMAEHRDEYEPIDRAQQVTIKLKYANALFRLGKFELAGVQAQSALAIAQELKSDLLIARSQSILCSVIYFQGRFTELMKLVTEGLSTVKACQDRLSEGLIHFHAGMVKWRAVSTVESQYHFEQAIELAEACKDDKMKALAGIFYGLSIHCQGQWRKGMASIRDARALAHRIGDRFIESRSYTMMAIAAYCESRFDLLLDTHRDGLKLAREVGWRIGEGQLHGMLGHIYLKSANFNLDKAAYYLNRCFAICEETGEKGYQVFAIRGLALITLYSGQVDAALGKFQELLALARRTGDKVEEIGAACNIGTAFEMKGEMEQARAAFAMATELCESLVFPFWHWQTLYGQARCLTILGDSAAAQAKLRAAQEIVNRLRNEFDNEADASYFVKEVQPLFESI